MRGSRRVGHIKGLSPQRVAKMSEVEFIRGLDGDLWAGMGEGRADEKERGGSPLPRPQRTPPPQATTKPELSAPPSPPEDQQQVSFRVVRGLK